MIEFIRSLFIFCRQVSSIDRVIDISSIPEKYLKIFNHKIVQFHQSKHTLELNTYKRALVFHEKYSDNFSSIS